MADATARYFDGQRAAAHYVALSVDGERLHLTGDTAVHVWPLRRVRLGGRLPDGTAWVTVKGDQGRLLVRPAELPRDILRELRRGSRRGAGRSWLIGLAGLACLTGIAVSLVVFVPRLAAPFVPFAAQDWLGRMVETQMAVVHHRCTGDGRAALQGLVDRLRAAAGITGPVSVTVLDDRMINAFTLPGDRVIVLRGLIDRAEDGDEVAGVLAHELGHVAHRDVVVMALRRAGMALAATALGFGDSGTLASIGEQVTTLSFSRSAEAAADASALQTLGAAGLRADGLGRFFRLLEARGGFALPGFLATHPPTADRIEAVTVPAVGAPAFGDAEWTAVRAVCRGD
jgi:beta-barrel assembly-enhancing protease